ncbi:MAG: response regulator transcription factor [Opitutaceae bacterium]|jgi:two-component system copper resistance phosphate regulon response regulator CusR
MAVIHQRPETSAETGGDLPILGEAVPRVLIVEDEEKTLISVAENLRSEGWKVNTAVDGKEALRRLDSDSFDLVVLDWLLPGCDGLEVLRHVRNRRCGIPVLMLTARSTIDDRVRGLDNGADDYMVKPFALAELVARCRTLLRRPILGTGRFLQCGDLQVDTKMRLAVRAGQVIALTNREVDILEYLMCRQGQVVTREMLERDIWKQPRRFTSLDNVIDVQMTRLRHKVDSPFNEKLIQTLRGIGYCIGRATL